MKQADKQGRAACVVKPAAAVEYNEIPAATATAMQVLLGPADVPRWVSMGNRSMSRRGTSFTSLPVPCITTRSAKGRLSFSVLCPMLRTE